MKKKKNKFKLIMKNKKIFYILQQPLVNPLKNAPSMQVVQSFSVGP
jgi:hypothetical protein